MQAIKLDNWILRKQQHRIQSLVPAFGNGIRLMKLRDFIARYYEGGDGKETLVFVPDAPNTIEHYRELARILEPHYRVVILELPGFGFSIPTTPAFDFSLDAATNFVIEFLDQLGYTNYRLCFSCVAGYIAIKAAAARPDIIKKLVILQTPSWPEEKAWAQRVDFKGLIATPFVGQLLLLLRKSWTAKQWYRNELPKDHYQPEYLATALAAFKQGSNYSLASAFQAFFRPLREPEFQPVKQPTLVIWGNQDRSHRKTNKSSVLSYFKQASLHYFEASGHFPELESPEAFAELIRKS